MWLAVVAMGILGACGGGGGGEPASPIPGGQTSCPSGSASTNTPDFSLTSVDVTINGTAGAASNPAQNVGMTITNPAVYSVVVQQTVSWLNITINQQSGTAAVRGNGAALVPGTYCTVVRVSAVNINSTELSWRDVAVKFVVSAPQALGAAPAWNSYNGNLDPTANGSLSLASGASGNFVQIGGTIADPGGAGTVYFMDYLNPTGTGMLRLDSRAVPLNRALIRNDNALNTAPTYPRYMTFLTRVAPVAGVSYTSDLRLADFELAFADSRVVFVLRGDASSNNVRITSFEQNGANVDAQLDMSKPHVFQISVAMTSAYAGTVTVYADGSDTPILGPLTTTNMSRTFATGQDYVQFGDNRSAAMVGDMDWMAWTTQGAYMPSQIKGMLPANLGVTTGY